MRWLLAALLFVAVPAWAQTGAPTDCSGTVGTTSTPITFSRFPQLYVTITNPNSGTTAKLAANPTGAAVIDGQGSFPMDSNGAFWTWPGAGGYPPPATLNIIASAPSTPFTCKYQ
jgi:hypothetical protein